MTPSEKALPEKPSYLGYAFANAYNLSLVAGAAAVAALTGDWTIGVIGAGLEALWLIVGADSPPFKRWVDKVHRKRLEAEAELRRSARIVALVPDDRRRAADLARIRDEIGEEAERNADWSRDLVREEHARLPGLLDSFLDLAELVHRYAAYARGWNRQELRRDLEAQQARARQGDDLEARTLAAQNVDLLGKRLSTLEDLGRTAERATAQMTLIENTFRLLRDQVVSLKAPEDLRGRLDELVASVDAIRAVSQDADSRAALAPLVPDAPVRPPAPDAPLPPTKTRVRG